LAERSFSYQDFCILHNLPKRFNFFFVQKIKRKAKLFFVVVMLCEFEENFNLSKNGLRYLAWVDQDIWWCHLTKTPKNVSVLWNLQTQKLFHMQKQSRKREFSERKVKGNFHLKVYFVALAHTVTRMMKFRMEQNYFFDKLLKWKC
jgi:hypothetical protein